MVAKGPRPRRTPGNYREFTALVERGLLVRVPYLAVVRHHVDSSVEVHRIVAVTAIDSVYPGVVVSLDYIVAGASAHLVGAAVVGAYEVRTVAAAHLVVAEASPDLVRAPVTRGRVVAA